MTALPERRAPVAFGRYLITRRIARGGMAEIYRAWTRAGGWVALKLMRPALGHDALRARLFEREAHITTRLDHPNVVPVHAYGEELGRPYLAMEYVHGRDLTHLVRNERKGRPAPPAALALWLGKEAAAGLGHAHRLLDEAGRPLGIVHRDVSPGNVMVSYDGSVKVLDFGVARMNEAAGSLKTQTGVLRGKFAYMSPEQTRGEDIDARSDVFSLGTVLYELITGVSCFRAAEPLATLERVQSLRPAPPTRVKPGLPRLVDEVLARCLAKEPERRFADGVELAEALDGVLGELGFPGRPFAVRHMAELFGTEREAEERALARELEDIREAAGPVAFEAGSTSPGLDDHALRISVHEEASREAVRSVRARPQTGREAVFALDLLEEQTETYAARPKELFERPENPGSVKVVTSLLAEGSGDLSRGGAPLDGRPSSESKRGAGAAAFAALMSAWRAQRAWLRQLRSLAARTNAAGWARRLRAGRSGSLVRYGFAGLVLAVGAAGAARLAGSAKSSPSPVARAPVRIPPVTIELHPEDLAEGQRDAALENLAVKGETGKSSRRGFERSRRGRPVADDDRLPANGFRTRAQGAEAASLEAGVRADELVELPAGDFEEVRPAEPSREEASLPAELGSGASGDPTPKRVRAPRRVADQEAAAGADERSASRRAAEEGAAAVEPDERPAPSRSPRAPSRARTTVRARSTPSGYLNVGAKPWGRIIIDGQPWPHATPQSGIELSAGRHTIELYNPETGQRVVREIRIVPGGYRTIMADLRAGGAR